MAITAALIGGAAALGAAGIGAMGRSNAQQQGGYDLQYANLVQSQQNAYMQQLQQALINQRAVAGSQDSFGTTVKYDPATNQWVTAEGAVPKASDLAALQAGITKNTTDFQQQEAANREAIIRAQLAAPAADAAIRNVSNYNPMSREALTGLLTQQGITAARETYDPLRADTLRAVARTGTAAGPVLAQLGRSEADNLRKTLTDAAITGLTGTDSINTQRQANALSLAGGASSLATPNLGQTGVQPSAYAQALGQSVAQRAAQGAQTSAGAGYGANMAQYPLGSAYGAAAKAVPDPNFGLNQATSGLKDLSAFMGTNAGQTIAGKIGDWVTGGPGTTDEWQKDYNIYAQQNPQQTGDWWNTGQKDWWNG